MEDEEEEEEDTNGKMQYDIQLKLFTHFACYLSIKMFLCIEFVWIYIIWCICVMPRYVLSHGPKNGRCQSGTDQNLLKRKSEGFLTS